MHPMTHEIVSVIHGRQHVRRAVVLRGAECLSVRTLLIRIHCVTLCARPHRSTL